MQAAHVHDITAPGFQRDVVERSMQSPVLLDFWAAWCGPCRTLGPVLERLAAEYGGAFELGKVDTEREQDLAYAFGVQGIPYCVLVQNGRPADAFSGALPEADVRRFLERNGITPRQAAVPAEPEDPASPKARLARALAAARRGAVGEAREALAGFPEEDERFDAAQRLASGLDWLEAPLQANGPAAEQQLAAARERFLAGDLRAAMEGILGSVAADKELRGGLGRRAMLLCFAVVGEDAEELDDYRRRLATLLY